MIPSPEDLALLNAGVPIGVLMPDSTTMRLVPIDNDVVAACVGPVAESVTSTNRVVFWFDPTAAAVAAVNTMATLNLLAVSHHSLRTVPLMRGPVLATGHDDRGRPQGLTLDQLRALGQDAAVPAWRMNWVLHVRIERDNHRRRKSRPS